MGKKLKAEPLNRFTNRGHYKAMYDMAFAEAYAIIWAAYLKAMGSDSTTGCGASTNGVDDAIQKAAKDWKNRLTR